ncbi:MAG TPA: alpha/beta hydrolase-fold protein [Blastocatellia bacterium]|jgi:S-formylglutathione hydrolase
MSTILKLALSLSIALAFVASASAQSSKLIEAKIESKLVPGPVDFAVLLPDGYDAAAKPYPLLFMLHGGGGDHKSLARLKPIFDDLWKAGTMPKMVIVTPSVSRSFYMDYRDGSEKWETFIVSQFLDHLRATYKVSSERRETFLAGISMGGMGALRMGLKYADRFGAIAALEPGIDPAFKWKDVKPRNRFWRSEALMQKIFGKPVDEAYWEANNPASIAVKDAERIRASGIAIYLDCGDEDSFNLHEATEFMHRVLWDNKIPHEYHLVRGADHVGRTIRPRLMEAMGFLERTLNPPPIDPQVEQLKRTLAPQKRLWRVEEKKP